MLRPFYISMHKVDCDIAVLDGSLLEALMPLTMTATSARSQGAGDDIKMEQDRHECLFGR